MSTETIDKPKKKLGKERATKEDAKPIVQRQNGGRPLKDIDPDKLYIAAQGMLPVEGLARLFDCAPSVLYDRFSEVLQKAREARKQTLSLAMWEKALLGKDTTMMIWLSKQHLGYKERQPEEAQIVNFNVVVNEVPK